MRFNAYAKISKSRCPGILHPDDISPGELRFGSRRRIVVEARGSISWIAIRERGCSGAKIARYLGVTTSVRHGLSHPVKSLMLMFL